MWERVGSSFIMHGRSGKSCTGGLREEGARDTGGC